MYRFARVEQKINQAVIKLGDLDEKAAPIVALVDFARKIEDMVRPLACKQVSNRKDRDFANDVCNRAHEANRYRRIVAHASFEPAVGGGVEFNRAVPKDGTVSPVNEPWSENEFAKCYADMTALEEDLNKLILLLRPLPPMDWYNSFQDTYHRNNSALRRSRWASAASAMGTWPPDGGKGFP